MYVCDMCVLFACSTQMSHIYAYIHLRVRIFAYFYVYIRTAKRAASESTINARKGASSEPQKSAPLARVHQVFLILILSFSLSLSLSPCLSLCTSLFLSCRVSLSNISLLHISFTRVHQSFLPLSHFLSFVCLVYVYLFPFLWYTYVYAYIYGCVHIHKYICICIYVFICSYVYLYIHTYINMYM